MPRDGIYYGRWGGYAVKFCFKNTHYRFRTKNGIRTPNVSCRILVENGIVTVEDIPPVGFRRSAG